MMILPDHKKWTGAWVGTHFLVGIKTTGEVKSERKNDKLLGPSCTANPNDLFTVLACDLTNQQGAMKSIDTQPAQDEEQIHSEDQVRDGDLDEPGGEEHFVLELIGKRVCAELCFRLAGMHMSRSRLYEPTGPSAEADHRCCRRECWKALNKLERMARQVIRRGLCRSIHVNCRNMTPQIGRKNLRER
jgi:hypothetical protein